MLSGGFLGDLCNGVKTFRKHFTAMTKSKFDTSECTREELKLWSGKATRCHLSRRNVEKAGCEIENGNAIRVPEDTRGDVDVESERGFTAKVDRLDDSASKFDGFKFLAIGVQVGEELPSNRDERKGWAEGDKVVEEIHGFDDDSGGPCFLGKILLDNSKTERCGIAESERNVRFPAGNLDAKVIDLDFAPSKRATYTTCEMMRKIGRYRHKRRCLFQLSTRAGLAQHS